MNRLSRGADEQDMTSNAPTSPDRKAGGAAPASTGGAAVLTRVLLGVAASVAVGTCIWLIRDWINSPAAPDFWCIQAIVAVATLLIFSCEALRVRTFWTKPTRRLIAAIHDARNGLVPIEELSSITGGIAPLIPIVRDMLRVMRQQKADLAAVEQEGRDRVARRTDALQRKIGSLELQAIRDPLTGLLNRRALEHEMPQMLSSFQSGGPDVCLLMVDVDNFKVLNDTLGHAAGDQMLKEIGQIIRSTIRGIDQAYRCGGDEFLIVLRDCGYDGGQSTARRLESLVEALVRPLRLPQPPRLSIGECALSELEAPTAESWLENADRRLYRVKAERRKTGGSSGKNADSLARPAATCR